MINKFNKYKKCFSFIFKNNKKLFSFIFRNDKKRKYILFDFQNNRKIKIFTFFVSILFLFYIYYVINKEGLLLSNINYVKEDLTLVTALYKMKSKYSFKTYLRWVNTFLKLNKPIIFFIDPKISNIIKRKRRAKFCNKTKWIELEMKDFYTYKNYFKYFNETNKLDVEKNIHTIKLYIVWT